MTTSENKMILTEIRLKFIIIAVIRQVYHKKIICQEVLFMLIKTKPKNSLHKKIIAILVAMSLLLPTLKGALTLQNVFATEVENENLILRYSFDSGEELRGETRYVVDDSGNDLDGVLVGENTNIIDGEFSGKKLSLKGYVGAPENVEERTDSYVQIPETVLDGLSEVTVATWVYFYWDPLNYWSRIFDIGKGTNAYTFVAKGGRASYGAAIDNVNYFSDIDAPTYADGVWTHIAVSYKKNCFSYYVNGLLYDTAEKNLPDLSLLSPAACAYIGKSQYAADACLTADIDEFRIYGKAMSESEIQNVMKDNMDDQAVVDRVYEILDIGSTTGITNNLDLPSSAPFGATVTWASDDQETISSQGVVNTEGEGIKTATLTATISYGNCTREKPFYVSVIAHSGNAYVVNIDCADQLFKLSDTFSAAFFEDTITLDGGLCAELIENSSFEFNDPKESWQLTGSENGTFSFEIGDISPLNDNNPHYATLSLEGGDWARLSNDGFYNMTIKEDALYDLSFFARTSSDLSKGVSVCLRDAFGNKISDTLTFADLTDEFTEYSGTLHATVDCYKAKLCIEIEEDCQIDLDMVSLFKQSDFKGIKNVFNEDLVKYLADLNPKALRFPGGCLIEGYSTDGSTLESYNNWKYSVGKREERKVVANRWGGYQSNTVGYHEYFLLCEALGAEPIPVVNAGMSCQIVGAAYSANDTTYYCPLDELESTFVQDALDLIEYANGDENTYWGRIRIESGHPQPFGLKYLAIGNEQWGDKYFERFAIFERVIKEAYPDITLITCGGPWAEGADFNRSWDYIKAYYSDDMVDEHYYMDTEWFLDNVYRYGHYIRDTKVYLGEYAVKNADGRSTLMTSLAEAAFITGLIKNGDVVAMHSYAPLFQRSDNSIWSPAMIWYNSFCNYASASYYTQKAFSNNTGSMVVSSKVKDNISGNTDITGGVFLGAYQTEIDYDSFELLDINGNTYFYDDFSAPSWTWDGPFAQCDPEVNWAFYNAYDNTPSPVPHWFIGEGYVKTVDVSRLADKLPLEQMLDTRFVKRNSTGWSNYTAIVKARKFSGNEGFMIGVGMKSNDTFYQFNYGGYGNSRIILEKCVNGVKTIVSEASAKYPVVTTGKEYEIRVEVSGNTIRCFVDGVLYIEYTEPVSDFYQEATYDPESGELIVKMVNTTSRSMPVELHLANANVHSTAKEIVLSGESPDTENTFDDPYAVCLHEREIQGISDNFVYDLDAYSMAILRIKIDYLTIEELGSDVMYINQTHKFEATSFVGSGDVTWSVDDDSVAEISANGTLTPHSDGVVTVTASIGEGKYAASYTLCISKIEPVVNPVCNRQLKYGDAFPQIVLSNGDTAGTICLDDGQELLVGTRQYDYTFIPTQDNYYAVKHGQVTLTVEKADVLVSPPVPKTFVLYVGDELPELIGLTPDGRYVFDEGQTLSEGTNEYSWTFVPEDTENYAYENAKGTIKLTVQSKKEKSGRSSACNSSVDPSGALLLIATAIAASFILMKRKEDGSAL